MERIEEEDGGNSVVRVRAQVMMRDDSTGGWVPMGGGGLSNVSVRKRKITHHQDDQPCKHEYLIHGKRISDQSVVLSCTIKRDFEYNRVMPTFHHWKTGNKKFGLTFQTAADARAFNKGVRLAIQDLLDGLTETSPLHQYNMDVGDDDVFMQLHLPLEKCESSPFPGSPLHHSRLSSWKEEQLQLQQQLSEKSLDYSYVKFPPRRSPHEYSYPKLSSPETEESKDSESSSKKPKLLILEDSGRRRSGICSHCRESFTFDSNPRGSCSEAPPDCFRKTIESISCLQCGKCLLYHCMSDSEGDYVHPCNCSNVDGHWARRWIGLSLLSILVPCLCCYIPLIACYKCGQKCNICGGKHRVI